jgi:hypothetical protein
MGKASKLRKHKNNEKKTIKISSAKSMDELITNHDNVVEIGQSKLGKTRQLYPVFCGDITKTIDDDNFVSVDEPINIIEDETGTFVKQDDPVLKKVSEDEGPKLEPEPDKAATRPAAKTKLLGKLKRNLAVTVGLVLAFLAVVSTWYYGYPVFGVFLLSKVGVASRFDYWQLKTVVPWGQGLAVELALAALVSWAVRKYKN